MPTPRHRLQAVRRRRRIQRFVGAALVAALGLGLLLASTTGGSDGGDAELTSDRSVATSSVTTSTTAPTTSSTTTTPSSTTSEHPTSTTTPPPPAGPAGWFAVVQSAHDDAGDRDAMEAELAEIDADGHVIDTDDFRTGDGQEPTYYPAPGLLAAVVGPFGSIAEVGAWCADYDGADGCHARQLVPL